MKTKLLTQAAVLVELRKPLQFLNLEIPPLKPYQVLVEMEYSAICGSQLNEIDGKKGPDPYLPHTLGHEGVGYILEVGPEVTGVAVGDRVLLSWLKRDVPGAGPTQYYCPDRDLMVNSGPVSTFLKHAVISQDRVLPLPDWIPGKIAPLYGCAIPTGMGMVYNQLTLTKDSRVAIIGLGGVGMSALIAASSFQPKELIGIDLSSERRRIAEGYGATTTSVLEPISVDFAIEAVGKKETMEYAFQIICPGGKCIIAGNSPSGTKMEIDPFDLIRGKQLFGSCGGSMNLSEMDDLFTRMKNVSVVKLVGAEMDFMELNGAIDLHQEGGSLRTILRFTRCHAEL